MYINHTQDDNNHFRRIQIKHHFISCVVHQCCHRHEHCRIFNVVPNQMDRDNVTAMETDKLVDEDIGNHQVRFAVFH